MLKRSAKIAIISGVAVAVIISALVVMVHLRQSAIEENERGQKITSQKIKKLVNIIDNPKENKQFSNSNVESHQLYTQKKIELNVANSLFKTIVTEGDYSVINGIQIWNNVDFYLKPELENVYDEISLKKHPQNTIAIIPTFTAMAYSVNGFYGYYSGGCDAQCLTVKIQDYPLGYHANNNAVKILGLLEYSFITDVDVDKNPAILSKYDKVILLHSEYVTRKEFDAITHHPHVVYLYPNALYAEIKADYNAGTITLVRGHSYPTPEITNGFNWKFDNSRYEYDYECKDALFYKVDNGIMLNCYPTKLIYKGKTLLKLIKDY